jgi:hypothetical protein
LINGIRYLKIIKILKEPKISILMDSNINSRDIYYYFTMKNI